MSKSIDPYRSITNNDEWMRKNGFDPERVKRLAKLVGSSVRDNDSIDSDDEQPPT